MGRLWVEGITDGEDRREYNTDSVCLGKFCHRHQVILYRQQRSWSIVVPDVIGTSKNHNHLRPQPNDIRAKTDQHLSGDLSAYAPVNVRLPKKELAVLSSPEVRDRIAHKHHALLSHCRP